MNKQTVIGLVSAVLLGVVLMFGGVGGKPPDAGGAGRGVQSPVADRVGEPGDGVPVSPTQGRIAAATDLANDVADGVSGGATYQPDQVDRTARGLGDALSPVTGGLSLLVSGLLIALRRVGKESKRRGRVIFAADGSRASPPMVDQVQGDELKREVGKVRGLAAGGRL